MNFIFIGSIKSPLALERFKLIAEASKKQGLFFDKESGKIFNAAQTFFSIVDQKDIRKYSLIARHIVKFFRLYFLCSKQKPSFLYYHGASSHLLALIPIVQKHVVIVTPQGSEINQNYRSWNKPLIWLLLNRAKAITAKSVYMASRVQKISSRSKIHLLNWGIASNFFAKANNLDFDNRPITIVSPRTNGANYNIPIIFDAIKLLKKEMAIDFIYVSLRPSEDEAHLDVADETYYALNADDMRDIFARADLMISIPTNDGFSTSIMECLATGALPVISDLIAYRDEFISEEYVAKIEHITVHDLLSTLKRLCNQINEVRSNRSKRVDFATKKFSRDAQMKILESVIYEALQK